jgi:amyloid beta precursor protein binding protein 1
MTSFKKECEEPNTEDIADEFFDPDSSVQWYIACRCVEMFRTKHSRYPGDTKETLQKDIEAMSLYVPNFIKNLGADESFEFNYDYIHEIARYSNSCLHNVGAVLGGVAAQEAVKLITEQYTPLNHTFIFDGAHAKSQVFNP